MSKMPRLAAAAVLALTFATGAAAAERIDERPLPVLGGRTSVSRIEPRLSAAATRIAGTPVEVRCWSTADWAELDRVLGPFPDDALAYSAGARAHLSPRVCASLVPLLYSNARPRNGTAARRRLALALDALAHESQKVAGIDGEAQAACYAVQRIRPLARMLGASKDYAAGLAVYVWRQLYVPLPPFFKSLNCRNGGPWDLNPNTSAWP